MQREVNKIPKCFSCPGDCKELPKKTKRSTYDSNQARTNPWPPTSDNNSLITKRIRTNETPKCLSNLGDCSGLSKEARRWNSRNQGSSQLTVTRASVSLPHEPQIQEQTKRRHRDASNYSKLQEKAGKVQTKARPLLLRRCGCGLAYNRMWVWFRVHAHKNNHNKNFILRCRDGKRTETRIGMECICITHSCIPPL